MNMWKDSSKSQLIFYHSAHHRVCSQWTFRSHFLCPHLDKCCLRRPCVPTLLPGLLSSLLTLFHQSQEISASPKSLQELVWKPLGSTLCVHVSPQLTCDNGMSPDTWSNEGSSPSLCHPLPPESSVQMTGRMTDLWYDCPMFVLTAPPHLAKNAMKSMWEQPCVHALTLDSPVENCPDLAWPNPAWKSHLLVGNLSREVEWAALLPLGIASLPQQRTPSSGKAPANRVCQLLPKPWKYEDKNAAWRAREQKLSFASLKHQ